MTESSCHRVLGVVIAALVGTAGSQGLVRPAGASPSDEPAPADASASYDALMLRAERERDAGAYARSAALFARAYRARPEAERADLTGEITVKSALADYRLAREQDPDDLALLQAQAGLMREFIEARTRGLTAGEVPAVVTQMEEEFQQLLETIDARSSAPEPAAASPAERDAAQPEPRPAPRQSPPAEPSPVEPDPRPSGSTAIDRPRAPGTAADFAILGIGLACVAGGMPLLIGGAVNFAQLERKGDARLMQLDVDPRYTEAEREAYRTGEFMEWQSQWRSRSIGMVVGGAVVTATGIGLVTWAAIRLRRRRQDPGGQARHARRAFSVGPSRASVVVAF